DQHRPRDALLEHHLRRAQHALVFALRIEHPLVRRAGLGEQRLHHENRAEDEAIELVGIGVKVGDRAARDAALHRRARLSRDFSVLRQFELQVWADSARRPNGGNGRDSGRKEPPRKAQCPPNAAPAPTRGHRLGKNQNQASPVSRGLMLYGEPCTFYVVPPATGGPTHAPLFHVYRDCWRPNIELHCLYGPAASARLSTLVSSLLWRFPAHHGLPRSNARRSAV